MPDENPTAQVDEPVATPAAAEPAKEAPEPSGFASLQALDPGEDNEEPQTPAPAQAKPVLTAPAANPVGRPPSRDPKLAVITDPNTREALKGMSNAAFNKFYDIALRHQNGEYVSKADMEKLLAEKETEWTAKIQSTRFLDHEKGYTLTPEYEQTQANLVQVEAEAEFWSEQLSNFRAGRPVEWLRKNETGQIVRVAAGLDPKDPTIEGKLLSKISHSAAIQRDLSKELEALPTRHKTEFSRLNATVETMEKALFGGAKMHPDFIKSAEAEIKEIPAALRSRPEFRLLGQVIAAGRAALVENGELKAKLAQKTNVAAAARGGAPDPSDTGADADDHDSMAADFKALDRMVRR